jgi:hypothetical protein
MLAHIVLTRLEDNEIPCFAADDNFVMIMPYLNQAVGGVKIKVFEHDEAHCREIMETEPPFEEPAPAGIETGFDENTVCPYCGSINTRYGGATEFRFHLPSLLVSLFFHVPLYFRNAWHCFNCHRDGE